MKPTVPCVSFCLLAQCVGCLIAAAEASEKQIYIMFANHDTPVLAMYKTESDGRLVTAEDTNRLTKAEIRWNDREAEHLKMLERFPKLKSIEVGLCDLRFPSLKHLAGLELTSLDASRCQVTPGMLRLLKQFPQLERLSIDFGLRGIPMHGLEIPELEVLRSLPRLLHLSVSGRRVSRFAVPRFWGHPKLESLNLHVTSVTVGGGIQLKGLPSLRGPTVAGATRCSRPRGHKIAFVRVIDGLWRRAESRSVPETFGDPQPQEPQSGWFLDSTATDRFPPTI